MCARRLHRLRIASIASIPSSIGPIASSASYQTRGMGKRKAKIGGYGRPGKLDIVFDEQARRCVSVLCGCVWLGLWVDRLRDGWGGAP